MNFARTSTKLSTTLLILHDEYLGGLMLLITIRNSEDQASNYGCGSPGYGFDLIWTRLDWFCPNRQHDQGYQNHCSESPTPQSG